MKDNYTATIYVNNYQGEYEQKSGNNLDRLITWANEQAKKSYFDVEIEVIDNSQNKVVEKRTCKLS